MKRILVFLLLITSPIVSAQTYYVDATKGKENDSLDGQSEATAWKTINKVNQTSFSAGDTVLFKRGNVWRETLNPLSSGNVGLPITFGAYGTGAAPRIDRTEAYSDWWEASLIRNGGMSAYIGALTGNDDFLDMSELSFGADCSLKADSSVSHSGTTSLKSTCGGVMRPPFDGGPYTKAWITVSSLEENTTYYFSAWGRVSTLAPNALMLRIKDVCNNLYLDANGIWQTPSTTVAHTWNDAPAADTWVQKSIAFTTGVCANGAPSLEIAFFNFQSANAWMDDLYFVEGDRPKLERVWAGYIQGVTHSRGAVANGARLPQHDAYGLINPLNINNRWFYAPNQSTGYFYLRDDSGNPGTIEVGARLKAIHVTSKSHLVLENLHATGPAAGTDSDTLRGYPAIDIDGTSSNVEVRNVEITNSNGFGIRANNTTSNITYSGVHAHDNGSTGMYINSNGGRVENSLSHDNGRLLTDAAGEDKGGIGSFQGRNIVITGNEVYRNGQDDAASDFEISLVDGIGPFTVTRNYIHDCIQGCVQVTELGGSGTEISYNIIDGFGTTTAYDDPQDGAISNGKFSGIRVGGAGHGATGVHVLNNVITGGSYISNPVQTALFVTNDGDPSENNQNSGLILKNNIFYNNLCKDVYVSAGAGTTDDVFNRNIYFRNDYTNNWHWLGTYASALGDWRFVSGLDSVSLTSDPMFVDPANRDYHLTATSPAIDAGENVGLSADKDGNPIQGIPDIGAYEGGARADVSISVTDTPDPTNTDSPMTYGITVSSAGPSPATNLVVTHTLPTGVTGSGTPSQGTCTGTSVISCNLGTVNNGQSPTITVTATPNAEALFDPTPNTVFNVNVSATTTVSANETDANAANNTATTATNVRLACLGQIVTKRGTSGNDGTSNNRFAGGSGADVIHTLSGNDWIEGRGANDTLCGGAGDDNINGNNGADALSGGPGTDTCNGGAGTDSTDGSCEGVNGVP